MNWKKIHESAGQRTYVLVFQTGDEVIGTLKQFAAEQSLGCSQLTAIGAFQRATLGYFEWDTKNYKKIPVNEQVEVVSLIGDITDAPDAEPQIHAHVVLGRSDAAALAGHLLEAHVRPTLEVTLVESPLHLKRRHDSTSGLALIRP